MDFTKVFEALIALFVAIITYVLVPFLRSKLKVSQQNEEAGKESRVDYWVKLAVAAAEQIFSTKNGEKRGKEKKAYVIQWLNEHDIFFDEETIDAKIECAVYEIKNGIIGNNSATKIEVNQNNQ